MKFRLLLFALLIAALSFGVTQSSFAQRGAAAYNYSHTISANPFGLVYGIFNATYEHQTAPINSFTIFGLYWPLTTDWAAYGIGGSFRWYPKLFDDGKRALQGFSVGPRAEINFWRWTGSSFYSYSGGTTFSFGGEAAYKWVWDGFALEPIITLMFNAGTVTGLGNVTPFGLGVNVGYAW